MDDIITSKTREKTPWEGWYSLSASAAESDSGKDEWVGETGARLSHSELFGWTFTHETWGTAISTEGSHDVRPMDNVDWNYYPDSNHWDDFLVTNFLITCYDTKNPTWQPTHDPTDSPTSKYID